MKSEPHTIEMKSNLILAQRNQILMNSKSTDSPGSTFCSWGYIQGPTRPLGGALLGSYWQGFHYCCFLDNFLCSSLSLSLWGTDIKTGWCHKTIIRSKTWPRKTQRNKRVIWWKAGLPLTMRWGSGTLLPMASLFLSIMRKKEQRAVVTSSGHLQIRGLFLARGYGPHNLGGLGLQGHWNPGEDNEWTCSPPPSDPFPLPWTLCLWNEEDRGMERMRRKRRMENDPASF